MPPVPLRLRSLMLGDRPKPEPKKTKMRLPQKRETEDEEIKECIAKSWIIYHLAGALAERNRRHNDKFATETLKKISLDLHHYVLTACKACYIHHSEYLERHPVATALSLEGGFEEWVFDLHNAVNQRAGKAVLDKDDHLQAVVAHYREALGGLGKRATVGSLSQALPTLTSRFCYGCQ